MTAFGFLINLKPHIDFIKKGFAASNPAGEREGGGREVGKEGVRGKERMGGREGVRGKERKGGREGEGRRGRVGGKEGGSAQGE